MRPLPSPPSLLASVALAACAPEPSPEPEPGATGELTLGQERVCADPMEGIDRLTERTAERGLAAGLTPVVDGNSAQGSVVARDLDGDGDVDLLLGRDGEHPGPGDYRGYPRVLVNDGAGRFVEDEQPDRLHLLSPGPAGGFAAVDLTGDGLPELLLFGEGWVAWALNEGGLSWGDPEYLVDPPVGGVPGPRVNSVTLGDADGDGDLDLLVLALQSTGGSSPGSGDGGALVPEPHPHLLFANTGEPDGDGFAPRFELAASLQRGGDPLFSQLGAFTDRDGDGDADLLVLAEYGGLPGAGRSAFWRNDGGSPPTLVDDAAEVGADVWTGAMGLDSADLDGDGRLDYCIVQFGPLICLHSGQGVYFDAADASGLQLPPAELPQGPGDTNPWSGYSLELADLDLDGDLDAAVTAGDPRPDAPPHADHLWENRDGRWVVVDDELGFRDGRPHYGMAAADLDGDGALELVLGTKAGDPVLWANRCSAHAWTEVSLRGPAGNRDGYGAQVLVEAGGRQHLEELYNLRTLGQGPARVHVGLGEADVIDRLEVRWPGGATDAWSDVPVNRPVTVSAP